MLLGINHSVMMIVTDIDYVQLWLGVRGGDVVWQGRDVSSSIKKVEGEMS